MTILQLEIAKGLLDRFKLKTDATKGGLSPAVIRGGPMKKYDANDVDAVLTKLRADGKLAFSGGLWWRR